MTEPEDIARQLDMVEATWKERFRELCGDEAADGVADMMGEVRDWVDLALINQLESVVGGHVEGIRHRRGDAAAREDVGFLARELQEKVTFPGTGIPPHIFTGRVRIDGQIAPDGAKVEARIDGVLKGSAVVMRGLYTVAVKMGSSGRVCFFVENHPTCGEVEWLIGGASMKDLDAHRAK